MSRKAMVAAVLGLALIFLGAKKIWRAVSAPGALPAASRSDLYTGKESQRKVTLYFASPAKPLPEALTTDIYATPLLVNQAKQVVLDLIQGPKTKDRLPVFPPQAALRELFIGKDGLAVVDFTSGLRLNHPGGTTAEYLTLYCLTRSLVENFPEIKRVQILVDGQRAETLAGHFDISSPLDMSSF